jgi:hypothetical protein
MPAGVICNVTEDGLACFTLKEYTKLLEMDNELFTEKEKIKEKDSIISNQGLIIQQKDVVIQSLEKDNKILAGQVERIGNKWQKCLDESEGFPWDTVFWGAGAGVIVGVAAAVVTYLTLSVPERAN